MRPFGLPPEIGDRIQLGETLRFNIDILYRVRGDDLSPLLDLVDEMADYLDSCIKDYAASLSVA